MDEYLLKWQAGPPGIAGERKAKAATPDAVEFARGTQAFVAGLSLGDRLPPHSRNPQ
jgi:hypothetical protein